MPEIIKVRCGCGRGCLGAKDNKCKTITIDATRAHTLLAAADHAPGKNFIAESVSSESVVWSTAKSTVYCNARCARAHSGSPKPEAVEVNRKFLLGILEDSTAPNKRARAYSPEPARPVSPPGAGAARVERQRRSTWLAVRIFLEVVGAIGGVATVQSGLERLKNARSRADVDRPQLSPCQRCKTGIDVCGVYEEEPGASAPDEDRAGRWWCAGCAAAGHAPAAAELLRTHGPRFYEKVSIVAALPYECTSEEKELGNVSRRLHASCRPCISAHPLSLPSPVPQMVPTATSPVLRGGSKAAEKPVVFDSEKELLDELRRQRPVHNVGEDVDKPYKPEHIIRDVKRGWYPQWNAARRAWLDPNSVLIGLVKWLRGTKEDKDFGVDITTNHASTMVTMGQSGTGTPPHCERHDAFNHLMGVSCAAFKRSASPIVAEWQRQYPEAAAVWVCVSPAYGPQLSTFLEGLGYDGGLEYFFTANGTWTAPGVAAVKQFALDCGNNDAKGYANVQIIQQKAGGMVTIPPGWYHWVLNLRPCIKVAWDPIDPAMLHEYILVWRDIVCGQIGKAMNADYTSTLSVLAEAITELV